MKFIITLGDVMDLIGLIFSLGIITILIIAVKWK